MNYQRFIERLPESDDQWAAFHPRSPRFQTLLQQVPGETTTTVLRLLNTAVACLEANELYCQIGCGQGAALIGALLDQERIAYVVEAVSERSPTDQRLDQLMVTLEAFGVEQQVCLCDQDVASFFADLAAVQSGDRLGVYFCHAVEGDRAWWLSLFLSVPFLAEQAVILVNATSDAARFAIIDFLTAYPQSQRLQFPDTPETGDPDSGGWLLSWNGQATQHPRTLAESWYRLGMVDYSQERFSEAATALSIAADLEPQAIYVYSLGLALEQLQDFSRAALVYQQAIALDNALIDAYYNLGNLVAQHGEPQQTARIYREAIAHHPTDAGLYLNLGNELLAQGQVTAAISAYEDGLRHAPDNADLQNNWDIACQFAANPAQAHQFAGDQLYQRQRHREAAEQYQALLSDLDSAPLVTYLALSDCYQQTKQYDHVIAVCHQGITHYPESEALRINLIQALHQAGQTEAAIAQATEAAQQLPDTLLFRFQQALLLPVLYQTSEEIALYRDRFIAGLAKITGITLDTPAQQQSALEAISRHSNFLLAYQNCNDVTLQRQYGALVHRIMATQLAPDRSPTPLSNPQQTRVRVGYVSSCFWEHTVGKLIIGWFQYRDRDRCEVFSYDLFAANDHLTQAFRQSSDRFYSLAKASLADIVRQIQADNLDILVFPEIGLDPRITQLAALRLAPVQCATWVHPVTPGLPTIDYFLSSDLMEPDDAQDHYSEQLIRLPNLAIAYPTPAIPPPTQSRSAFRLREEAAVYLVSQLLCKLLPQQDQVFAAIARQVPHAQFVFIARPNPVVAELFRQRLAQSFAQIGLNSEEYCLLLPPQSQPDYWNLNQICDVFLDSFGWSGGHTTLEAIACGLPIVTLPGNFMRGRHSSAILQMLGVTDTIAATVEDYIEIAVRLGLDPTGRQALVQRMGDRHSYLYDDISCVTALEDFFHQVARSA